MFNLVRENIFWSSVRATPYAYFIYGLFNVLNLPSYDNIYYLVSYIIVFITNGILKQLFKLTYNTLDTDYIFPFGCGSRPKGCTNSGTFLLVTDPLSSSFGMPSGHSQLAWFFSTYLILNILFNSRAITKDNLNIYLLNNSKIIRIIILLTIAVIVSYSRVYIDKCHTLGQVITGGIIGIILAVFSYIIKSNLKI